MRVVSDASPLITLARVGHLDSLNKLYDAVHISTEVYEEIVIAGAGMPGATAVGKAEWIRVLTVQNGAGLAETLSRSGLGLGELSAIFLGKELPADLILMDEWKGRKLATEHGLAVVGSIGILEEIYRRGDIGDLARSIEISCHKRSASIRESSRPVWITLACLTCSPTALYNARRGSGCFLRTRTRTDQSCPNRGGLSSQNPRSRRRRKSWDRRW